LGALNSYLLAQAQAEKIRSVQGMLQRFRTLFNLPSAIRGNIRKGEYDLAVREYQKAKSIVLPSHVSHLLNYYLHLVFNRGRKGRDQCCSETEHLMEETYLTF
jgi:exocyst complex component 2